jgi:ABC-type multidrug transport system permease subunit
MYRINDPVALQSLIANTGPVVASSELLLVMSIIFVVPILMSVLTLTLKYPVSRWANRIMGIFYAIIPLAFLVLHLVVWRSAGYEIVWATAQIVFGLLVVWYTHGSGLNRKYKSIPSSFRYSEEM